MGTFAVQLAKLFGAEVTGVCSTKNVDLVRSLGADHVIDYSKEDFCRNGQVYDLILGINGNRSIYDYERALSPHGKYFMVGGSDRQLFQGLFMGPLTSRKNGRKMNGFSAKSNQQDLNYLKGLLEAGKIKPVIDKVFPLSETADALRYITTGHTRAKIIVRVD